VKEHNNFSNFIFETVFFSVNFASSNLKLNCQISQLRLNKQRACSNCDIFLEI